MKQTLFIILLAVLTQTSCTKKSDICNCDPSDPISLNGKWRMIIVKDNTSGSETTKPLSIKGDVDIIFTISNSANGTFIGNTPTNEIWPNDFSVGLNQSLIIPDLSMTKVGETSWGNEFVDNIRSSQAYSFENCNKLTIKTTNKTLTFQRL